MKRPNEFKTGLLVLGGFAIIILVNIIIRGVNISQDGYTVYVRFPAVSGIEPGSDVRMGEGEKIGKVVNIVAAENSTIVETRISRAIELTTESRGDITSSTFLSGNFVSISSGKGLGTRLMGGETIDGEAPMSMVDGIREFGLLMKNLNSLISTTGENSIFREITDVVHNAATNLGRVINSSGGDISATFTSLRGSAARLDRLVAELQGGGDKAQAVLSLLKDQLPAIMANLNAASANLAKLAELAASGQGSLSLLLTDKKLYADLLIIADNMKVFSTKLRNDPSILIWRDGK
ncbi:MAG: MlaD family protein [Spirochaetota bacterium]|jgi:phospholipid/cholesterol/gamma-HCH transport system substrate-binding protein|nr:MlaD family protein [Spirochaetota bacterium]